MSDRVTGEVLEKQSTTRYKANAQLLSNQDESEWTSSIIALLLSYEFTSVYRQLTLSGIFTRFNLFHATDFL